MGYILLPRTFQIACPSTTVKQHISNAALLTDLKLFYPLPYRLSTMQRWRCTSPNKTNLCDPGICGVEWQSGDVWQRQRLQAQIETGADSHCRGRRRSSEWDRVKERERERDTHTQPVTSWKQDKWPHLTSKAFLSHNVTRKWMHRGLIICFSDSFEHLSERNPIASLLSRHNTGPW